MQLCIEHYINHTISYKIISLAQSCYCYPHLISSERWINGERFYNLIANHLFPSGVAPVTAIKDWFFSAKLSVSFNFRFSTDSSWMFSVKTYLLSVWYLNMMKQVNGVSDTQRVLLLTFKMIWKNIFGISFLP